MRKARLFFPWGKVNEFPACFILFTGKNWGLWFGVDLRTYLPHIYTILLEFLWNVYRISTSSYSNSINSSQICPITDSNASFVYLSSRKSGLLLISTFTFGSTHNSKFNYFIP